METKIKDLGVEEFKLLIASTVRETMEDLKEDTLALSSSAFLASIEEARKDYKEGKILSFEEGFDV